jgi:hypothetical protein
MLSFEKPPVAVLAKGTPLSLQRADGATLIKKR